MRINMMPGTPFLAATAVCRRCGAVVTERRWDVSKINLEEVKKATEGMGETDAKAILAHAAVCKGKV